MLTLFFALMMLDGPVAFGELVGLAPIPDDSSFFMEEPSSFDFDSEGNYYIVDAGARTIFKWDKQGRFVGTIGKPGQGPGEFVMSGRGPSGGMISIFRDKLYVMDARKREIIVFAASGEYERAIPMLFSRGRVLGFAVKGENEFLFHWRRMGDDGGLNEVVLLNQDGKVSKTLDSRPDDSFQMRGTSQANRTITIKAFNETLVTHYNRASGDLLSGYSGEPSFQVISADGSKRNVKLNLLREDVTKEDQEEYKSLFTSRRFQPTIEFPDKKAYYSHLLSLGDAGFLVYNQSEPNRHISGVQLDKTGKPIKRFELDCGLQGGLLASAGRVMNITLNEDEEFEVRELKMN